MPVSVSLGSQGGRIAAQRADQGIGLGRLLFQLDLLPGDGDLRVLAVDAVPTALAEAGDLFPLLEKGRLHERQLIELGDVITGRRSGRESPDEITLFESQGMAIQDLAVALRVVQAAEAQGFGTQLPY